MLERVDGGGERAIGRLVCHDDELGVLATSFLSYGLDRHVVLGEDGSDRCEHASAIGDVERDVVAGLRLPHRVHRELRVRRLAHSRDTLHPVARDGHDVAEHGARRRRSPRTRAVEHQLTRGGAFDEDGVVRLSHARQRMAAGDHRRVDAYSDVLTVRRQFGDREELDDTAHRPGAGHVGGGDVGDPLPVDVGRGHPGVERKTGEDRRLRGRVEPLDVGGRVSLGISQCLGLLECLGEARASRVHPVEDVVGRAVDDAEHPTHAVSGERLPQRADQRDRGAHRRLVVEVDAVLLRRGKERGTVLGEQRLVRRDHRGAVLERREDERARWLDPPDHLHHDVDVRPTHQLLCVRRDEAGIDRDVTAAVRPTDRDTDELERRTDPGREILLMLEQQPDDLRTHHTAAEKRDTQRPAIRGPAGRHPVCHPIVPT